MSVCEYAELDGSYVLGALSPTERQGYERHLTGCTDCARSVRELAGLPGLLSRVDPVILEPAPPVEPVPATLLPSLVQEVGRARRRRVLAGVAVAAAAVAALAFVLVQGLGDDQPPAADPPPSSPSATLPVGQHMRPVGDVPVTATLAFTPVGWGTRLDLTCSYRSAGEGYHQPRAMTYGLFVVNRDGSSEQVGTWEAISGKTMHFSAGTAAPRKDIAAVEVRNTDGRPVLELTS